MTTTGEPAQPTPPARRPRPQVERALLYLRSDLSRIQTDIQHLVTGAMPESVAMPHQIAQWIGANSLRSRRVFTVTAVAGAATQSPLQAILEAYKLLSPEEQRVLDAAADQAIEAAAPVFYDTFPQFPRPTKAPKP